MTIREAAAGAEAAVDVEGVEGGVVAAVIDLPTSTIKKLYAPAPGDAVAPNRALHQALHPLLPGIRACWRAAARGAGWAYWSNTKPFWLRVEPPGTNHLGLR